jgi:ATP-dependent Lon protease
MRKWSGFSGVDFPRVTRTLTAMDMEIVIPEELPLMTLPRLAFFPQAMLPLHIFEPRYREMLRDVLASNRLFAVAGLDRRQSGSVEPPHRIATLGIVRACQESQDGTSNLLLQGLSRVEIQDILRDTPYRTVRVRALSSEPGADHDENLKLRARLSRLIATRLRLSGEPTNQLTRFSKSVEDPATFVDLAAFNFCENVRLKQKLLETLNVHSRLELLSAEIQANIELIKLRQKLQGGLADDGIVNN